MIEKWQKITFNVLGKGDIIYTPPSKYKDISSYIFDQNGTFCFTSYRPKKKEIIGTVTMRVPDPFTHPHMVNINRETRPELMIALEKAKFIADKHAGDTGKGR